MFIHSFEGTGELKVTDALASHAWVKTHNGASAVMGGGAALTSAIPTASDRKRKTETALFEVSSPPTGWALGMKKSAYGRGRLMNYCATATPSGNLRPLA